MTKSWLDEIVDIHSELESPVSFWLWGGLVSISAVVKDNVWLNRHLYNLYPNIYVMLHAESGLKKGPPVAMAFKLMSAVGGINIIKGRSSIQGILKQMGSGQTAPGGKIVGGSAVTICSSEMSSSIVSDPIATTILTDLYDRQYNVGEWKSLLKMESFELKNPTVTMFTATNEAHAQDFFAKKDLQGGYFARTFIIYENSANRDNSLSVPLTRNIDYTASADYLKCLSKLKGEFKPLGSRTPTSDCGIEWANPHTGDVFYYSQAGVIYEEWYYNFKRDLRAQTIKDETGTLNRFGDSVLKVAMLLSLARAPTLEIDEQSMIEAISHCEKLIGNVRQTTLGSRGLSQAAVLKTKLIQELLGRETHMISRPVLMKKMWMHYGDSGEFDELMASFQAAGLIEIDTVGNQCIFRMPPKVVEEWQHFFEGKLSKS